MLSWSSIKFQAIILIAILVILPAVIIGIGGIFYYRNVIRDNIWDNNLAEARAISALTVSYTDLAQTYLKSLADRPLVIKAIREEDVRFLDFNAQYLVDQSDQIDSAFFTDRSGTVLSSYPHTQTVGRVFLDRPYVGEVLNTSKPYVSIVQPGEITGKPTVYLGIPIVDDNNTVIGTLVGTIDLISYRDVVAKTQVKSNQYVYLVNTTGRVMVHSNSMYMDNMADFSSLPAVANVIQGKEGVLEQYFPFENDHRLVAYSPVAKHGWGVVVATPVYIAYRPIDESSQVFIAFIAGLLFISLLIAIFIGKYLTEPILRINSATSQIPDGDLEKIKGGLPVHRKDEIGSLARSFLTMAGTVKSDRDKAIAARNQADDARARAVSERERAEDEKNRAELYVDIMGHDINNLNQAAMANLELLELHESLGPEQKGIIEDALTAIRGSASVIDSVRTIQRASEEKITLEVIDLNNQIEQCIREAPRPTDRMVAIHYQSQKDLLVIGNTILKTIFCNLINNSIKHSTTDVTIDIAVRTTEKQGKPFYDISIEDNGPGISDSVKPALFNRFQRGATKAKGRGLGLFIVRTIAERFGGNVIVEDRIPGDYTQGSRFIVSLPRASGRRAE